MTSYGDVKYNEQECIVNATLVSVLAIISVNQLSIHGAASDV